MKIVFVSNYLNHHQLPFCRALSQQNGTEFFFVATQTTPQARLMLGYRDMNNEFPFVIRTYENDEERLRACELCGEADVVIIGSAPWEYVEERLTKKRVTFLYSERIYKNGVKKAKMPIRFFRHWWKYRRHKPLYLLCASAYTAGDYARTRTFLGKAYKWGYFPEVKRYEDFSAMMEKKNGNSLLWVGRFIDLKHPEAPIEVARRLLADGYEFELNMIGTGEVLERTKALAESYGLSDYVHFLGSMSPELVRGYMEQSGIFMFTSDRGEGWGAVLNESMNSGCAVVASHAIGSVPFLVKDGQNGLIYRDGNLDDLYHKVKWLLDYPKKRESMGANAYRALLEEWNADNAAKKFLVLAEALLQGKKAPFPFDGGVASKAELLHDDWFMSDV